MPQYYYKNGKLYVSEDGGKTGVKLYSSKKGNITLGGINYFKYNPTFYTESIDNSFTPITEQQINDAKKVIEGSGKIGDKIKYLHSKVNLMSSPKKKNIAVTGSSTSGDSKSTSKKRTQYQLPKGVESRDDIMRVQQMLADANKAARTNKYNLGKYGINGDGVDGIWGAMTDAAYKLYLKDLFNYYANNAETEPVTNNTKTEPVNENSLLLEVEISPVTPSFNQTINPSLILDRGDVRNIFRQYGMNPYLFTGSQRKSFRKWLGGDKTQNIDFIDRNSNLYQDWVAPYMTFQSSTVDRFKRGGIVKKFQEGNKFNFIKVEDITQKFKKIRKGQKGFLTNTLNKVKSGIDSELKKKNLSGVALLLHNLYEIGAFGNIDYDKAVDGTMGPRTKQALKKAKAMGYNFDEQVNSPITVKDNSLITVKDNSKHFTEIDPKDKKEFAEWLYLEGKDNFMGNSFDTIAAYFKSLSGLGSSINVGEGTKKLLIALHLLDNHNISKKKDGTIKHSIDKDKNGDYRWLLINGKLNVHNERSVFAKAGGQPAEHIMGQYTMYETPDNYHVSDVYNFNDSGTDYSKRLIDSDGGSLYEYLRYFGGKYGSNKDIPVEIDIPKRLVLEWYNDFKSGKGVAQRAEKIKNEYNNKGYVGFGRQTYL